MKKGIAIGLILLVLSSYVSCRSDNKPELTLTIYYDTPVYSTSKSIPIEKIKSIDTTNNIIVFDSSVNKIFLAEDLIASGKPYLLFMKDGIQTGRIYLLPGTSSIDWDYDSPYVIIPLNSPRNPLVNDSLFIKTTILKEVINADLKDSLNKIYSHWVRAYYQLRN
jgi:hypothetical protein